MSTDRTNEWYPNCAVPSTRLMGRLARHPISNKVRCNVRYEVEIGPSPEGGERTLDPVWSSMGLGSKLAFRLIASWLLSLLGMILFAIGIGQANEGFWAVRILSLTSLPLIALALVVTFVFPHAIRARPMLWGGGAVLLSIAAGFAVAKVAGLAFAALIAVPAFVLFVGSVKVWPGYANPATDSGRVR